MLRSISLASSLYPLSLRFNPCDLCLAAGTTASTVKYWELQDYSLVSETAQEPYTPLKIEFEADGKFAFVGFYDSLKCFILDDLKPRLLDIVGKGGMRDLLSMKLNDKARFVFTCESSDYPNAVVLSSVSLDDINYNPRVAPKMPNPSMLIEQKPIQNMHRLGKASADQQSPYKNPSILA